MPMEPALLLLGRDATTYEGWDDAAVCLYAVFVTEMPNVTVGTTQDYDGAYGIQVVPVPPRPWLFVVFGIKMPEPYHKKSSERPRPLGRGTVTSFPFVQRRGFQMYLCERDHTYSSLYFTGI